MEGDEGAHVFVIERGCMKAYKSLADGRRQIISFAFAGNVLGWIPIGGRYTSSAEAITPTTLLSVSRTDLDKLRLFNHGIETELMGVTSTELEKAQEHLMLLGRKTATERLVSFIKDLSERGGLAKRRDILIELPMSQEEIADYLGLRQETVSRALSTLRKEGVVQYESRKARLVSCSFERLAEVGSTLPI